MMARRWTCIKLAFKLSSEDFSCQREQSQTCLSYAEYSRKSLACKMYEPFSIVMSKASLLELCNGEKKYENS